MAEMIAGSPEALRERPFVSFITLIISPFKIDDLYGEMTCYLASQGLPVVIPTEPICGTTSPVTLAGNVLTHIAETLGGITLVQSVNKGAPGICGSVGSITNLRTMNHVGGAIERVVWNKELIKVNLEKSAIGSAPRLDPGRLVNEDVEQRLRGHYGQPGQRA